jgi:putative ABC transport system ATP-binding protein
MLEVREIRKSFNPGTPNEVRALQGVNFTLENGSFVIIIGTNWLGKIHNAQCCGLARSTWTLE